MARVCCNCGGSMEPETIHGITIDVCTNCNGVWMSGDELRALMNSGPLSPDDLKHLGEKDVTQVKAGASTMLCPDNHVPLDVYHYEYNSPLIMHVCPVCGGLWVAAGEIEQMEEWRAKTAGPQTAQERTAEAVGTIAAEQIAATSPFRKRNMDMFFGVLNQYSPGWIF